MILHKLAGIVGREYIITSEADMTPYSVDFFWVPRLMVDRGRLPPMPDVVVLPGTAATLSWMR